MKNLKKTLLFVLIVLSLLCFVSCKKTANKQSENASPTVAPQLTIESITSTHNSLSFEVSENDPHNVGNIKEIYVVKDNEDPIYAESVDQREFTGLYSGRFYYVSIIYAYDLGQGEVTQLVKKGKYTLTVEVPEYYLSYVAESSDTISFTIEETDPDNVSEISKIELINQSNGETIVLDDLSKRTFTGLQSGKYTLKVSYTYNLNAGKEDTVDFVEMNVSTKIRGVDIPDFIVEVPEDREPVILQLTDTQIIDAGQTRPGREGVDRDYWGTDKLEDRLLCYLRETIEAVKPDLIIMTGDIIYGEFDDKGTSLINLINAMESFGIPWAPVFGNHEQESMKGADWQSEQLENAEHCLFLQRELTGNGNYTVGISQGGVLTRIFFMMDSNGCSAASNASLANGQTKTTAGFGNDQIAWFEDVGSQLKANSPETKVSFAFHIQFAKFGQAYSKYGFTNSGTEQKPINIDIHPEKQDSDFGYLGADFDLTWDYNYAVYNKMVAIGCDSIFVGHEHCESASVVYEGVRFQFGQKISTYDKCNWRLNNGSIIGAYAYRSGNPIMGGTVLVLSKDGTIDDAYIYYCGGVRPPHKA